MPTLAHFQVGVHGIKIEFGYGRSTKTATFLPDVAKEQGLETSWGQIMLFSYPILIKVYRMCGFYDIKRCTIIRLD